MRIYSLLLFIPFYTKAQTVNVSGRCISGTIVLNKIENIEGKPAFQGTGTVMGLRMQIGDKVFNERLIKQ